MAQADPIRDSEACGDHRNHGAGHQLGDLRSRSAMEPWRPKHLERGDGPSRVGRRRCWLVSCRHSDLSVCVSPMTEPIQTTRMRRLPTVLGVFPTFSDEIPDVKRFAQVNWLKSLTLEGKCLRRRAKPAHIGGHLPFVPAAVMCGTDRELHPV